MSEIEQKLRGLICAIFGHRAENTGWWGDSLYGAVSGPVTDGTGRTHYTVRNECVRCGKLRVTARFHGSQVGEIAALEARCAMLEGCTEVSIHAGVRVTATFTEPAAAFALFNELSGRAALTKEQGGTDGR